MKALQTNFLRSGKYVDSNELARLLGVKNKSLNRLIVRLLKSMSDANCIFPEYFVAIEREGEYRNQKFQYFEMSYGFTVLLCTKLTGSKAVEVSLSAISALIEFDNGVPEDAGDWLFKNVIDAILKMNASQSTLQKEAQFVMKIKEQWMFIFPAYDFVASEYVTKDGDRIDILAKHSKSGTPVIIEVKAVDKSAHKQLRSYAYEFENPILINFTPGEVENKADGIIYMSGKDFM